jgi:hypothetical protein
MRLIPQITVFLENQPGTLSTVCRLMKDFKINIEAFTVFGTVDHGVLRMIVDKPASTKDILAKGGFLAIESNVIEIESDSHPGVLYKISALLAKEDINIEYGYGSSNPVITNNHFFLQASNNAAAMRILKKHYTAKAKPAKKPAGRKKKSSRAG